VPQIQPGCALLAGEFLAEGGDVGTGAAEVVGKFEFDDFDAMLAEFLDVGGHGLGTGFAAAAEGRHEPDQRGPPSQGRDGGRLTVGGGEGGVGGGCTDGETLVPGSLAASGDRDQSDGPEGEDQVLACREEVLGVATHAAEAGTREPNEAEHGRHDR
jgi:hypothetical protein